MAGSYNINNERKIEYRKNYKNRIIAFVDILGFKNLVEDSTTNKYEFQKILDSLERFRGLKKEKEDQHYIEDVKVTTFSDSLVISYPSEDGNIDAFYSILLDLTRLQLDLLDNNVIIRGGIAIGQLRHTQNEIFGPAMNEAYRLESKVAKYPRIVICKDTVTDYIGKEQSRKKIEKILRSDEVEQIYYLDYLGNPGIFTSSEDYNMMLQMVQSIIRHGKHTSSVNTFEKYRWLDDYYNIVLAENFIRIADVYENQNEYSKALGYYEKARVIRERILGLEHPDTAAIYAKIAGVYHCNGGPDKALEYYVKARAIREKILGPEHPDTARSYYEEARFLLEYNKFKEAKYYYEKAYKSYLKAFGRYHPDTEFIKSLLDNWDEE